MIQRGRNRKPPPGSVGSRITGKRPARRRVGEKRSDSPQLVSVRSRGLTPRDDKRRENRAVAVLVWLCVIIFLALSGTMLTYQSYAFLAGDKADVEVPEVVGMIFEDAAPVVEDVGLVLRIRLEAYSDDTEADIIMEQLPASGARVKIGRVVLVDVSRGSRTLVTPNVIGMERPEAIQVLDTLGVGNQVTNQYSDIAANGTVINQSPPTGTPIALGERVELVVSAGPLTRAVEMPHLEGLLYEDALRLIDESRLTLRRVSRTYIPGAQDIKVATQYPLPSTPVMQGEEVLLTLSAPTFMQYTGQRSIRVNVNVPESLGTVQVRITVDDRYENREVYTRDHTGPTSVEQLVTSYGRTTVRVYFDNRCIREETF